MKYNLKNFNLTQGKNIGGWILLKKLGSGGNGEVWQCRNADTNVDSYAIKFLKWNKGERYERFVDEVVFMESYQNISGVLPIIDKNLPKHSAKKYDKGFPIFYVMPLAESFENKMANLPMSEKIDVIKQLLEMLTNLHSNDVAHRDIKPTNILYYNNKFVLSDFGLVYFAQKTAKTPKGTKVGPQNTISPQMLKDATTADKCKADVYSMAKTIWIILTGNRDSFDGQYVPKSNMCLCNYYIDLKEQYFTPLDVLLQQCTSPIEKERPTAEELELKFCEWEQINKDTIRKNLSQWRDVQKTLFPIVEPTHAEWDSAQSIHTVLSHLGGYDQLCYVYFPNGGSLPLHGAKLSDERDCIVLDFGSGDYIVKPKRLSYVYVGPNYIWNYFILEASVLTPRTKYIIDEYMEEFYQTKNGESISTVDVLNIPKVEADEVQLHHVIRLLKGYFIIIAKHSIYSYVKNYPDDYIQLTIPQFKKGMLLLYKDCKKKPEIDLIEQILNQ